MRAVYIHIPFCKTICSYCDFCKFLHNDEWARLYLDSLSDEVDEYYEGDIVKSIYIGGGSPSSLSTSNITKLFSIVNKIKKYKDCEITFECNINDINSELLQLLSENGVNRLSIGIQSFDKKNLEFLGRNHNKKSVFNTIKLVKSFGFKNINVDLMYALSNEKLRTVKKDLKTMLKLGITHISTYSLIIEEHTKIYNDGCKSVDELLDFKMYKYICNKLAKKGFNHYEVSNFALDGYESEHNLTYWDNEEYYGFGISSHGFINGNRYENTRNLTKYLKCDYRFNEFLVSTRENMENELILGLRKLKGVSISNFEEKFKRDIFSEFKFDEVIKKGYIVQKDDYLFIPENKIYVMNEILNMIM